MRILCYLYLISISWCVTCCAEKRSTPWTTQERDYLVKGLTSTKDSLHALTHQLSNIQWNYREDRSKWSIAEVVGHLALHDALYYRELRTATKLPAPPIPHDSLIDEDDYLMDYTEVTAQNRGKAPWYLDPRTHGCSSEQAWEGFSETRDHYIEFLKNTQCDLRSYFSPNGRGKKRFRDLHQLVMISIAHTERHLKQIQEIRRSPGFPD